MRKVASYHSASRDCLEDVEVTGDLFPFRVLA